MDQDEKLTFKEHIENIARKCHKRLNLLKALTGREWGASPEVILYTYKSYIRPILEYGCSLFAHADKSFLTKIQAIETSAIKIAFRLPPWATNTWCYNLIKFENILTRIKTQAKNFVTKNSENELISPLIEENKASTTGNHSPLYKILNW